MSGRQLNSHGSRAQRRNRCLDAKIAELGFNDDNKSKVDYSDVRRTSLIGFGVLLCCYNVGTMTNGIMIHNYIQKLTFIFGCIAILEKCTNLQELTFVIWGVTFLAVYTCAVNSYASVGTIYGLWQVPYMFNWHHWRCKVLGLQLLCHAWHWCIYEHQQMCAGLGKNDKLNEPNCLIYSSTLITTTES
eukprot:5040632-Amphidinium_carterae.2